MRALNLPARWKPLLNIASFALGTGTQAALGFLSIPLLVRVLGAAELGKWSVIEATFQIGAQIALLGFNQTLIKYISGDGLSPWPSLRGVARFIAPAIILVASSVGVGGYIWLSLPATSALALAILLCFECWNVLGLSASRAASMPLVFSAALIVRASCILLGLVSAVYIFPHSLERAAHVLWLWVAAYFLVSTMLTWAVRRADRTGAPPSREMLVKGFHYGGPLLVALLLAQMLQYADRFFVAHQLGFAETGRYFIHAKVANILAIAAMPVQLWWPVARFQHLKDPDGGAAFFARASLVGVGFFSATLFLLSSLAPLVFRWFAPSVAFQGDLLAVLMTAMYIQVSAVFFNVGLLDAGSTHLNAIVWAITAVVQLILQAILVGYFGALGAAVGLLGGAITAFILQHILSQKRRHIRYPIAGISLSAFAGLFGTALILKVAN